MILFHTVGVTTVYCTWDFNGMYCADSLFVDNRLSHLGSLVQLQFIFNRRKRQREMS